MSKLILGLDLGPNSIGWALVDDDPKDPKLVDLGVRVFPEGVDAFDTGKEKSRNEDRRIARGMRRQILRRVRRRKYLREALIEAKLWPAGDAAQAELYKLDPYELRARGLHEKLEPHKIGRVLLHLNQRRGFKSNKKEEAKADAKAQRKKPKEPEKGNACAEKKTEDILLEMSELAKAIEQSSSQSLGEYLYHKMGALEHANRVEDDHLRGRHTQRKMLMEEFNLIWNEQAKHYPNLLTDNLRYGKLGRQKDIRRPLPKHREFLDKQKTVENPRMGLTDVEAFGLFGILFFHRTLKPVPKEVRGLCELESKQRRCARADRRAQRYRLLQEINNLRYIDPDLNEERSLNDGQRAMLQEYLATREKATFDAIRKKLGFLDTVRFNLEKGKRSSIQGMVSDWLMAKSLGKQWHATLEETKDSVVEALVNSVDDDETHELLVVKFDFSSDQADAALSVDLPDGYLQLSLVAINKLLPHLERGLVYEHRNPERSARAAAGYDEPWALRNRLFDKLPDPQRMSLTECPIGDIPNPVVKRTLNEVRRVVNAILCEYRKKLGNPTWTPDEVHVEMGRDVKTRPKADPKSPAYRKYKDAEKEKKEREDKNTAAKNKLRENNLSFGAAGRNILKYLLWEEQGQKCIYSGKCISFTQLFTDEIEIDHILPKSQSLEDFPMNKVVCFRSENHPATGKGQRTPREWLEHSDRDKYEAVCQRAKKLPYPKYKRFLRKNAKVDDFIDRQLNDTRYIAKATVEYLKCLFEHEANKRGVVLGLKGQLTATLRRQWGLETVLQELPDSPGWQDEKAGKLRPGEKNRADHRHHAIDAAVLAMTNRSRLQKLAKGFTVDEFLDKETGELEYRDFYRGKRFDPPWDGFRDDVKLRLEEVNVSHRVERKIRGSLHKKKFYGPTSEEDEWVVRKPLADLSPNEIERIRDKTIRQLVEKTLTENGIEFGRSKNPNEKKMKEVLSKMAMPSGVPIKNVRIIKKEQTIQPVREGQAGEAYVKPGSTHHLCIFEWEEKGKVKRDAVFVTMLEAIERLKRQQQELARSVAEWKKSGLSNKEIRHRKRRAMSDIAKRFPIIERTPPQDHFDIPSDAQFVMSLSGREMVLANWSGEEKLLTYKTATSTNGKITFADQADARKSKEYKRYNVAANKTVDRAIRKVTVDPLGRIRWAND